jgi:hypothetical protein
MQRSIGVLNVSFDRRVRGSQALLTKPLKGFCSHDMCPAPTRRHRRPRHLGSQAENTCALGKAKGGLLSYDSVRCILKLCGRDSRCGEGSSATLRVGSAECRDGTGSNMNSRDGRAHVVPRQQPWLRYLQLIPPVGVSPARVLAKIRGPYS